MHDDLIALLRRGWKFGLSMTADETIRCVGDLAGRRVSATAAMPIVALAQAMEDAKVLENEP